MPTGAIPYADAATLAGVRPGKAKIHDPKRIFPDTNKQQIKLSE